MRSGSTNQGSKYFENTRFRCEKMSSRIINVEGLKNYSRRRLRYQIASWELRICWLGSFSVISSRVFKSIAWWLQLPECVIGQGWKPSFCSTKHAQQTQSCSLLHTIATGFLTLRILFAIKLFAKKNSSIFHENIEVLKRFAVFMTFFVRFVR